MTADPQDLHGLELESTSTTTTPAHRPSPGPASTRNVLAFKGEIRKFVETNFYLPSGESLADDASLLEGGVLDSTGVLEVIVFLEERYGIKVADQETTPENLDSISRIADFLERKLQASGR